MQINADLSRRAVLHTEDMDWVDSPMAGVRRRMLERDGEDGDRRATSVVRYAPGSRFSPHVHVNGEEFLVLDGTFSDERADYPAGTYVRNPPGSRHAPHSTDGTTIFVKLQQFDPGDATPVIVDTNTAGWTPAGAEGVSIVPLHAFGAEKVSLVRFAPGARIDRLTHDGGAEVLVLEGTLEDEHGVYPKGTWLRLPPGTVHGPFSREGSLLYLKEGHLVACTS